MCPVSLEPGVKSMLYCAMIVKTNHLPVSAEVVSTEKMLLTACMLLECAEEDLVCCIACSFLKQMYGYRSWEMT